MTYLHSEPNQSFSKSQFSKSQIFLFMKNLFKCLAGVLSCGIILTVGCQKMDEQAVAPKDAQQEVATSEDITRQALAELSVLRQPNGKLINQHFVKMIDLGISSVNKYTTLLNSLSKEEQKARQAEVANLLKLHASDGKAENAFLLMGYSTIAEYRAFENQYAEEKHLLNLEDPDFKNLSREDLKTIINAIHAHHRRNGYHDFVRFAGAPVLKFKRVVLRNENDNPNSTLPTTASYREEDEDDEACRPCREGYLECAKSCEATLSAALAACPTNSTTCKGEAEANYTNCAKPCADGYDACAKACK